MDIAALLLVLPTLRRCRTRWRAIERDTPTAGRQLHLRHSGAMPPTDLPYLVIDGEPLARFCQRWRFPLDRMTDRSSGEWYVFLFLTPPGPLLDSLEALLGIRQLDAVKPFLASTDWARGTEDAQKLATSAGQLPLLRLALLKKMKPPHWWETDRRAAKPLEPDLPF